VLEVGIVVGIMVGIGGLALPRRSHRVRYPAQEVDVIAHADVHKPPALVRPHVPGRYVWVFRGSSSNGWIHVRVWCTAPLASGRCGHPTWPVQSSGFVPG